MIAIDDVKSKMHPDCIAKNPLNIVDYHRQLWKQLEMIKFNKFCCQYIKIDFLKMQLA